MDSSLLVVARIVGVVLESMGYGIYLVTSFTYFSSYHCRPLSSHSFNTVVKASVATILFVIATTHLALNCYRIIFVFAIYTEKQGNPFPSLPLSDIRTWDNIMSSVLVVVQCTLGDAIPIYRVFVVYDRSWKVIAPSLVLYLGGCVCTAYFIYLQSTLSVDLINVKNLVPLGTAFWAVTVVQNTLSTSLLVYRIWRVSHKFRRMGAVRSSSRSLDAAMKIIAASGLLYTLIALLTFVAEACGSLVAYPSSDLAVVIVGIAFNLLITRSAAIFKQEDTANTLQGQFTPVTLKHFSKQPATPTTPTTPFSNTFAESGILDSYTAAACEMSAAEIESMDYYGLYKAGAQIQITKDVEQNVV